MVVSPRIGTLISCIALALIAAGCASHRPHDELADAVATGERPVAMRGETTFFGQQVHVTVTVSRGIGHGTIGGGPGGGGGGKHGGRRGGGASPDISSMDSDEASAYLRAKAQVGSPMPPVTLHLKLENMTGKTFSVAINDFNSDLGNFAVHPEVLALAPSQSAEPDPMVSQMGVTSDLIPFQVTLKLDGKKESQTIQVKNIMAPAQPPAPGP